MLVDGWQCDQGMLHVVGADAMSLFAVFANGEQRQRRRELGGCCFTSQLLCTQGVHSWPFLSASHMAFVFCFLLCAGVMSNGEWQKGWCAAD